MDGENKDNFNEERALFLVEQNDENFLGYKQQLEEVNNKVIGKLMKVSLFCLLFIT